MARWHAVLAMEEIGRRLVKELDPAAESKFGFHDPPFLMASIRDRDFGFTAPLPNVALHFSLKKVRVAAGTTPSSPLLCTAA